MSRPPSLHYNLQMSLALTLLLLAGAADALADFTPIDLPTTAPASGVIDLRPGQRHRRGRHEVPEGGHEVLISVGLRPDMEEAAPPAPQARLSPMARGPSRRVDWRGRSGRMAGRFNGLMRSGPARHVLTRFPDVRVQPTRIYGATGELQIRVWSRDPARAQEAADALRAALSASPEVGFAGEAATLEAL